MAVKKPKDLLLYSTNTELAYKIAREYYNNIFYVWCTDAFDAALQPGTSNPRTLCSRYLDQILKCDRHAVEIEQNKAGILKGASEKLKQGIITDKQHEEISARVAYAEMTEFYPIVFLIDRRSVRERLEIVEPKDAASNHSVEYILKDLKWNEFEIIRFKDVLAGVISPVED